MMAHRPRRPAARRGAAALALGALSAAFLVALPPGNAAADSGTPASPSASSPAHQALSADEAAAKAQSTGRPVVASALTTAVSQTTANPDGTLTLAQTAAPTRVLKNGAWTAIDPALAANPDGTLSPKATPSSVILSGGGTGPLLSLHTGGQGFTLTLPTSLPAPTVSGASAEYAGILPGVDLTVTVDPAGAVSDVFTLHTPAAARNPQLTTLLDATIATTPGLTAASDANGNVQIKDAAGHALYTAPTPLAWDSAEAADTADTATANALRRDTSGPRPSSALRRGAAARSWQVGVTAGHGKLALTPPAALLGASDTHYPVFVDPTYSPAYGATGWASPGSGVPSQNFWKSSVSYTGDAEVGPSGDVQDEAISLFNFPVTTSLKTAKIYSAYFDVTETYSWACHTSGHNQKVDLYAPTKVLSSSNATWNNWSGVLGTRVDQQDFALGYNSGCPAGGAPPFDVTSTISKDLTAGTTAQTLVMRADSHTDNYALKRFKAGSAQLVITYDKYPNTPKGLFTSPQTNCSSTVLGDTAVSLYAPVSTPTGAALTTTFTLYAKGDTTKTNLLTPANGIAARTYHGASGQNAVLKVPEAFFKKVSPGGIGSFSWTVSTSDGTLASKASATPCSFGWDASRPGDPEVHPADPAPADSNTCPTLDDPGLGSVQPIGARCSFTVAPPAGESVSGFEYQLNQSAPVTVDVTGPTTITVPVSRLVNTLTVIAFSPGGNLGEPKFVEFTGTGISPAAGDGDVTMDGTPDLVTVGGPGTALPSGAWLSTGHPDGTVNEAATDIGVNGLQTDDEAGTAKPSDWDGAQAVTGDFCGNGAQDVLAYFSGDGSGAVVCNDGSASSIVPGNPTTIGESSAPYEIPDGTFADADGTTATQVVTAGNTSGANTGLPDLLATMNNTLYLTYSFTANGYGFLLDPDWGTCASCYALTSQPSPDGTQDWDNWTLATTQLTTGTALYLWNPATGELDLWTGLGISGDGTTLTTTDRIQLAATGWNQNPAHPLTLHAADLGGNGEPSLRAVDRTTGQVTPYLFDGTALTPQTAQTVSHPAHLWPLKDGVEHTAATTATDAGGSLALTGSASGAGWDTDTVRGTVLTLDGTGSMTSPAALSMSAPFSLSLWAKPAAFGGVIASQDGTKNSGFLLYSQSDHTWSFCMATSDTTRAYDCAAGGTAVIGQWAHLTATYDPATQVMDLFVDGRLVAHGRHTAVSGFTGKFTLGNDLSNGARASFYSGSVSDVETWNGTVLTIDQVTAMSNLRAADPPYTFADLADYDGDGHADVVAADTYGNLWLYQGSGAGKLVSGPLYIGTGFTGYTLVGVADFDQDGHADVIARAPDNTLRLFPGDAGHNLLTPTVTIGTGWGGYSFAGVRDFTKDGKPDVVAKDGAGDLWLYPGTGAGAHLGTRVQLGNGWSSFTLAGLADFDKDGNLDVIARDSAGLLWNYHGNGSNDVSSPTQVGTGWTSYTFAGLNDFNGDGNPDAVARDSAGVLWFYPRTATSWGARVEIGHSW